MSCLRTLVLWCRLPFIYVSIHLYSASCSAHHSEVLPVLETREKRVAVCRRLPFNVLLLTTLQLKWLILVCSLNITLIVFYNSIYCCWHLVRVCDQGVTTDVI